MLQVVRNEDGFNLPPLNQEDGTSFGWYDRINVGMTVDGLFLTDYSDWEARDLYEMLSRDYQARRIENVLTLPIVSAEHSIVAAKGDGSDSMVNWLNEFWEQDHLSGGCRTPLDQIVNLMTSAFSYKRAYFEKVWRAGTGDYEGRVVYDDLAWRPQTTCRIMRDPFTGRFQGFQQEAYYVGPQIIQNDKWPIEIPANRAFVYTHATRRDPLNGSSDLEIAYWAWKTKQKILMLWMQFLQSVSLPRIIVKANDIDTAKDIGAKIAQMKSSGVLPVAVPGGPASVGIESLDVSGKGADQFKEALQWLDNAATQSILAGFLDLTSNANSGTGSYALSADASDFFLQSLEAKAREMEYCIRRDLFAPLIRYNFGPTAPIPKFQFEPLNDIDKSTAVSLLQQAMMIRSTAGAGGMSGGLGSTGIPDEFVSELAQQVANYIGLDGAKMKDAFDKAAKQQQAQAAANVAGGASPMGQAVAGAAGAVGAAQQAMSTGTLPNGVA